ncbi:PA2817 family protein [Bacterioplanoides pacificum]|uniref:PA2817 family protein n=1 Tax=Bacterioplanoides pacificum TaxID=1171596 RepID=A0ABV7VTH4_9GAMM
MNQPLSERLSYHIELLKQVQQRLQRAADNDSQLIAAEILQQLEQVIEQLVQRTDSAYQDGQDWLMSILTHQPQLTPTINRDLLWFFGGDCLHFMTDAEIELFQQLDEQEAEHDVSQGPFDRAAVKTLLQQNADTFDA